MCKLKLGHLNCSRERLAFTEAFRKGYCAKDVALRRLSFDWVHFPEVKSLFRIYGDMAKA